MSFGCKRDAAGKVHSIQCEFGELLPFCNSVDRTSCDICLDEEAPYPVRDAAGLRHGRHILEYPEHKATLP